jgi:hypothetical protein
MITDCAAAVSRAPLPNTVLSRRYEFGWSFVDSAYFMVQTITSIGYGDLVPENDRQRIEVTTYMLLALTIAAIAVGIMMERLITSDTNIVESLDSDIQKLVEEDKDRLRMHVTRRGTGTIIDEDKSRIFHGGRRRLIGHEVESQCAQAVRLSA